jgi:hypothetical protein
MRARALHLVLATTVLATTVAATTAAAVVLCAQPRGDGTFNTTVKLREMCKAHERQLDPDALGLRGPAGPKGDTGDPGPPGPSPTDISVRVYNSSPIAVAPNTDVVLSFDSERWDTANLHDPGMPSRLTAPVAGKYLIICEVSFPTNGIGSRGLIVVRNGVDQLAVGHEVAAASYYTELTAITHYQLAAGDWVEAHVSQESDTTLSAVGYPSLLSPECSMVKLP